ncbi:RNA methyltransferase [Paenibacillus sanfengchensis]|uniref:TRM11 family SAM-dependent methyltransferase n=1 Tax=Paenibacillus sanfengchensis TaxID=3119819 RepID=UPI002FE1071F
MDLNEKPDSYIYPYACHENESELCRLELHSLFGYAPRAHFFMESGTAIGANRSPFISMEMKVLGRCGSLEGILTLAEKIDLKGKTFKVKYIKNGVPRSYEDQRQLERTVGARIRGRAEMRQPDILFGLLHDGESWRLGVCHPTDPIWQRHKHKPRNYSTGLSAAMARSLVNIAVPATAGIRAIDPCCGMGNVLIEALSMGIEIVGRDLNPLAIRGARVNLAHFGYRHEELVSIGDMNEIDGHFDAAILDMPYNLCSVLPLEEKRAMLSSLRRFSDISVVVSTEELEPELERAGFQIQGFAKVTKGAFVRSIWVCHS